ncbi:helix-turn-helix transcriptional regulator [Natribaculum luteum]|uniref:helix-turn-helix transcriptional regulator n=1 Tax=Natribaculum luteum TaxID=1586232 RepID=UPI00366F01A2
MATEIQPLDPADPQQVIRINVTADGDARWTIESRYLLETDADVEAFEAYADAVASGEREVGYDASTFERFQRLSEQSTDRDMSIENASWDDPRVEPADDGPDAGDIGVISYSFTWSNFAAVDGTRLYLGDAFRTADGTWLPKLSSGQRLVVEPPPNYGFEDPPVGTEDGALVWSGPHQFEDGELEVTLFQGAGPGPSGTDSILPDLSLGSMILVVIAFVALLALVGLGGYLLAMRYHAADGSAVDRYVPDHLTDERSSPAAMDDASAAAPPASDAPVVTEYDGLDDEDDDVDVELLSDEERVHRLLRKNGGRMKQASIVKETGWSNAKVSQLLSKMDDDGEIRKLRIGRENLITLPEVDLTEVE